jgi:hypothetical protein
MSMNRLAADVAEDVVEVARLTAHVATARVKAARRPLWTESDRLLIEGAARLLRLAEAVGEQPDAASRFELASCLLADARAVLRSVVQHESIRATNSA